MRSTTDTRAEDDQVREDEQAETESDEIEAEETEADELDDEAEDLDDQAGEVPAEEPAQPQAAARRPLGLSFVIVAIALVVAVSGGIAWVISARSDDVARADQRDAVLIAAKQEIATLNTLDYRRIPQGIKAWSAASSGTLRDQFSTIDADAQKVLADQGKISTGKVVDAAVTRIDGSTAEVIASVETTVRDGKDAEAEPAVKRNRFSAELTRSGGTWKVSRLDQVAVDVQ